MAENYYTGEIIRIALVADQNGAIRDAEFADCHITGPAVILPRGCEFTGCSFDGDVDAILWEVPATRREVVGPVLVDGCRFVGCRFMLVGIAGAPDAIADFRQGLAG